jgi:hypothetical protein
MRDYMIAVEEVFGVRKCIYIPVLLLLAIGYIIAEVSPNVEVRYVYGVLPAFVWHNPTCFKASKEVLGTVKGPIVLVYDDHIDGSVLSKRSEIRTTIRHELVHVKQEYRSLFLNTPIIFLGYDYFIDNYPKLAAIGLKRLIASEAEAYVETEDNIPTIYLATMLYHSYVPTKAKSYGGKNLISYAYVLNEVKKYKRKHSLMFKQISKEREELIRRSTEMILEVDLSSPVSVKTTDTGRVPHIISLTRLGSESLNIFSCDVVKTANILMLCDVKEATGPYFRLEEDSLYMFTGWLIEIAPSWAANIGKNRVFVGTSLPHVAEWLTEYNYNFSMDIKTKDEINFSGIKEVTCEK